MSADHSPLQGPPKTQPRPRAIRRKAWVIGGIGLFVLIVGAIVARNAINNSVYSPSKPVLQYLSALERGDAAGALSLIDDMDLSRDERAPMTNAVYGKATDRPANAVVTHVERRHRDLAYVTVRYEQGEATVTQRFPVRLTSVPAALFDTWVLESPTFATSSVVWELVASGHPSSILVNGVECPLAGEEAFVFLLPGTYTVAAPAAGKYWQAKTFTVTVAGDADPRSEPVSLFGYRPSDLARSTATQRTADRLEACRKAAPAVPKGCPLGELGLEELTWEATQAPKTTVWAYDGVIVAAVKGNVRVRGVRPPEYAGDWAAGPYDVTQVLDFRTYYRPDGDTLVEIEPDESFPY